MLRDALCTSKLRKAVVWLNDGSVTKTEQLCQYVFCKPIQVLKVRAFDYKKSEINLAHVLKAVQKSGSEIREIDLH